MIAYFLFFVSVSNNITPLVIVLKLNYLEPPAVTQLRWCPSVLSVGDLIFRKYVEYR